MPLHRLHAHLRSGQKGEFCVRAFLPAYDLRAPATDQACPWLFTWDDHEVQNDYAGGQEGRSGPDVPDFRARRAAAYQAWYEHTPVPASVVRTPLVVTLKTVPKFAEPPNCVVPESCLSASTVNCDMATAPLVPMNEAIVA